MSEGIAEGEPFRLAFQSRPEILIPLAGKRELSSKALAVFGEALRNGRRYFEHRAMKTSIPKARADHRRLAVRAVAVAVFAISEPRTLFLPLATAARASQAPRRR